MSDSPKMIAGQTPYTPAEMQRLNRLIDEAAENDPGEDGGDGEKVLQPLREIVGILSTEMKAAK